MNRMFEFPEHGKPSLLVQYTFPVRVSLHEVGEESARNQLNVIDNHEAAENQFVGRVVPIDEGNRERMVAVHENKIQCW